MTSLDVRHNAHTARHAIISEIAAHWDEIVALSEQRSGPGSIGEAEYGDASFHKTPSMLRRERFEEYADALFYYQLEHHNRE